MKKKKILRKLAATALALGLGVSSMISVSAMSPIALKREIIKCQDKNQILSMESELRRNGFDDSIIEKIRDANGVKSAIGIILSKLSVSQGQIDQIKSNVQNIANDLTSDYKNFLNNASRYSSDQMVWSAINQVKQRKETCLAGAKAILKEDHSLHSVNEWKNVCEQNYRKAQEIIKATNEYISGLDMQNNNLNNMFNNNFNNMPNNFNNFGFSPMQFGFNNFGFGPMQLGLNNFVPVRHNNMLNNFVPVRHNNMRNNLNPQAFNNNFNFRNFNNMPNNNINQFGVRNQIINNDVRPVPVVQNHLNNRPTKKELEDRFKEIKAGKQPWDGPCWLYATTTAINEFRNRKKIPLIKRKNIDNKGYSDVEREYMSKGFTKDPLSKDGNTADGIIEYAKTQGLDAVNIVIQAYNNFNFSKEDSVKFATKLLRHHFDHSDSPVLIKRVPKKDLHEVLIAGIVGDEFLLVDSWDNSVRWYPIGDLSKFYVEGNGNDNGLDIIFVRDQKEGQQRFDSFQMLCIHSADALETCKDKMINLALNF